jgi:hypothetical protein
MVNSIKNPDFLFKASNELQNLEKDKLIRENVIK